MLAHLHTACRRPLSPHDVYLVGQAEGLMKRSRDRGPHRLGPTALQAPEGTHLLAGLRHNLESLSALAFYLYCRRSIPKFCGQRVNPGPLLSSVVWARGSVGFIFEDEQAFKACSPQLCSTGSSGIMGRTQASFRLAGASGALSSGQFSIMCGPMRQAL